MPLDRARRAAGRLAVCGVAVVLACTAIADRAADVRQRAEAGDADAQAWLGYAYRFEDLGLMRDYAASESWLRKAADQGNADAQHLLGLTLSDDAESADWLARASAAGHDRAQLIYGQALVRGVGVARDVVRGYAWLNVAAARGVRQARAVRNETELTMTPQQIREAQALSRELHAATPHYERPAWLPRRRED